MDGTSVVPPLAERRVVRTAAALWPVTQCTPPEIMAVVRVSQNEIDACGGLDSYVEGMIESIRSDPMDLKEKCAAALNALALQGQQNVVVIVRHGGLQQLIKLADVGSHNAQAHAAGACATIISTKPEYAADAARLGGITPICKVLRQSTGGAQEAAAAAIASISAAPQNVKAVIEAGAISPLASLLKPGNRSAAQVYASHALGNLASLPEGQRQAHGVGAVKHLLALLGSGQAQQFAARALARMAHDLLPVQQEVFKSGGIAMLLALLSGINDEARVQSAIAISELCQGAGGKNKKKTQDAIAKSGGIGPLLAAISSPTSKQPLVAEATHALAMLAKGHRANQVTYSFLLLSLRLSLSLPLLHYSYP